MKGDSKLFNNTSGDIALENDYKETIVNKFNKNKKNVIPETISQINHIFRKDTGHLEFSEKNVKIISDLINNEKYKIKSKDKYGKTWYCKNNKDGTQLWGSVYNNKLSNAGLNNTPRTFDNKTGLNKNPYKRKEDK